MFKENKIRDVFHSFLVKDAEYEGELEIPKIKTSSQIPNKIIPFSKARNTSDYDCWVAFYEYDSVFECLWNNPQKYITLLKKFRGIITPDYSLYCDMPLVMQLWNIYRVKAIGFWLQSKGIEVIPNVRWGDERTLETACLGIEKGKTIAVGTHGCIKSIYNKKMFINGIDYIVGRLKPQNIIVYGRVPNKIFSLIEMLGIKIYQFESDFAKQHKKEVI